MFILGRRNIEEAFVCLLLVAIVEAHNIAHDPPVPKYTSFQPFVLKPFQLNQVTLLPGTPAYDGQQLNKEYLHYLNADSLLYNFMMNAGLNTTATPLGGWEAPDSEVRGHFTAFYITASAKAYNTYGDVTQKEKADYMVSQLALCQEALGNGYLSAFPESFFDRLEALQPVWAPYYMIHKIMQALWDMHTLASNQQAYPIILKMADYFVVRIRNVVKEYTVFRWHQILYNEYGGMNEFMYILYNYTGNPDHLYMAQMFDMGDFLGPLAVGEDYLTTFHANQHIPIVLGAAARYETLADDVSKTIFENFYGFVVYNRTYATGGHNGGNGTFNATNEHWGEPGMLSLTITNNNQEFCTTYNTLKVTMHVIQWSGDVQYFDYYERAYFNGILGTQDAESGPGVMIYNYPMGNGFSKNTSYHGWGTPLDSFWCCYASAVEQWAKMGEAIYFQSVDDGTLYVNLFVASTLNWSSRNITITQITAYPVQQGSSFVLNFPPSADSTFTINVHIPYWVTAGSGSVFLNGQKMDAAPSPSSFLSLLRKWSNGDVINITLPFSLHLHYMDDDPYMVAVMYGPLVLGGLTDSMLHLMESPDQIDDVIKPVAGQPLTFLAAMEGGAVSVTMQPLYTITGSQVYGVYWRIGGKGGTKMLPSAQGRPDMNSVNVIRGD